MLNLSRIRLITFDVTDTLLKFRTSPGKQYGEIGAIYGVLCDNNALAENFKLHWHKMNKEHPNFGLKSGLGWYNWWKTIIHGTFKDGNYCDENDNRKLDSISADLIEMYKSATCWQPCYGSQEFLQYLKTKNIKMGVISNFDPRVHTILENMKIKQYFSFVVASYEAGYEKPNKAIFEAALNSSELADISPDEALHIGDSPNLDYFGAVDAGWHSILINDRSFKQLSQKYPDLKTDHVFRSLYDLQKKMESYIIKNNS